MKYTNTVAAKFIDRPNRFIAHVKIGEKIETVHVKNTGRCKELLTEGASVILCEGTNPNRKTKYDLIAVYKETLGWVNIDSQVPNTLVKEWLTSGKSGFQKLDLIRPEYSYDKSRIDFYLEKGERKILLEVKGCTLEKEKEGYFPDAPTKRGVKHLYELAQAVEKGYECYVAFVIAMEQVTTVHANVATDPEFGEALNYASKKGVRVLFLPCKVEPDEIEIEEELMGE